MRRLPDIEIRTALELPVPCVLSTLDPEGYPYMTPIWFLADGDNIVMSSGVDRPHVRNLRRDPRAAFVIEHEGPKKPAGRPNVQVKGRGRVQLVSDHRDWTRAITIRYGGSTELAELRAAADMVAIVLPIERLVGLADGPDSGLPWWEASGV